MSLTGTICFEVNFFPIVRFNQNFSIIFPPSVPLQIFQHFCFNIPEGGISSSIKSYDKHGKIILYFFRRFKNIHEILHRLVLFGYQLSQDQFCMRRFPPYPKPLVSGPVSVAPVPTSGIPSVAIPSLPSPRCPPRAFPPSSPCYSLTRWVINAAILILGPKGSPSLRGEVGSVTFHIPNMPFWPPPLKLAPLVKIHKGTQGVKSHPAPTLEVGPVTLG